MVLAYTNKSEESNELKKKKFNRYVEKRLHVRPEHIRPSSCRAAFVLRVKENDKIKSLANKEKRRVSTKR